MSFLSSNTSLIFYTELHTLLDNLYYLVAFCNFQPHLSLLNIEDLCTIIFNGDKCGFEVTKSPNNTNCSIEYKLDIVLGGIVLDEENDKSLFIDD